MYMQYCPAFACVNLSQPAERNGAQFYQPKQTFWSGVEHDICDP